ncbi:MAG TPA: hypothetical protein VJV79_04720 [Polyangiaceae bacterium]|nr:hypothetical protein [Polyangiaceae bacterium]
MPPPLPETILLTDADLVDDDPGQSVRASQPTSVDVELDCFTRSEPPPESHPQRKRGLLAIVTGLVVVAGAGLLLLARPVATQALSSLNTEQGAAARAPAMLSVAAQSAAVPPAPLLTSSAPAAPNAASSPRARSKLSVHAKRGQAAVVNRKKPTKPVVLQRVLPDPT